MIFEGGKSTNPRVKKIPRIALFQPHKIGLPTP